ncbi:MAG: glycoside hydrolase family 26 protein [Treponema sp.]|nr:glycoside hydrolase family 26 protein [Treponema sp.]
MKKKIFFILFLFSCCFIFGAEKSAEAQKLLDFLTSNYGKQIISGQMDLTWADSVDMADRVYKDTGKYPVLMGYDFMNYTSRQGEGLFQTEEAIKWAKGQYRYNKSYNGHKGGIVAFTWHWRGGREKQFYTNQTKFRIPFKDGALDETASEFGQMKRQMDTIAKELKRLQDAGVPVLWRPLHEASGKWFWWGASGPEAYKALWKYMYTYYSEEKGLNNLIWVWNGQNKEWYPGDDFVDITGEDIYSNNHDSQKKKYLECKASSKGKKMVALTECGRIPDPEKCAEDDALWLYFMVWNDKTITGNFTDEDFWSSDIINSLEFRKSVYNSDKVLTLDEIKDLL